MTIGFRDKCPSCSKNIDNFIEEIKEENIFEPFVCPFCEATLEFKKSITKMIITLGSFLLISLLASLWCRFVTIGCSIEWKNIPWNLSQTLIILIFVVLLLQDLRIVKESPKK